MASPSRTVTKIVIALAAVSSSLVQAQDRPDVPPGESLQAPAFDPRGVRPLYLVTYFNSTPSHDPLVPAAGTVVSVTNLTREICNVSVEWFLGFAQDPICSSNFALDANVTAEFCTRDLPSFVSCDSTCEPPLEFGEGRAIVGADCNRLGLSGRVHYVTGVPEGQEENGLLAITDSKIVRMRTGNQGD
jgi:hypothetical protein